MYYVTPIMEYKEEGGGGEGGGDFSKKRISEPADEDFKGDFQMGTQRFATTARP